MKKVFILFLSVLLLLCNFYTATASNKGIEVHFIDVGQADASVILCGGEVLMIDGGNKADSSLIFSYLRNTLKIQHIDYMIATHPHEDHIGGLPGALNACSVGVVYSPVPEDDSDYFNDIVKYAGKHGVQITVPSVGDSFIVGEAKVEFLSPMFPYKDKNDLSLVVRIDYGNTSFLFTGDATNTVENDIINAGVNLAADVIKVGHHGSDKSTTAEFLQAVNPQYAVISVGRVNSHDHPGEYVLSLFQKFGVSVYRTDTNGHIICRSDGNMIEIETQKKAETAARLSISSDDTNSKYTGNKNTKKFHYSSCQSVADMKEKNKIEFQVREEAISMGYIPCKRCNP